jgi:hypothetical protein
MCAFSHERCTSIYIPCAPFDIVKIAHILKSRHIREVEI